MIDVEATVRQASRSLGRLLDSDPLAAEVLTDLDRRPPVADGSPDLLAAWKRHELLRIAARDLTGLDALEAIMAALSAMATDVLAASVRLAEADGIGVIAMGKLGAAELNYASDVDVLFVGDGDHDGQALDRSARRMAAIARRCFRVDLNLRPEGRDGALVRSPASYEAYWSRWADPWERQALLKAAPVAGDADLGAAFAKAAATHLWGAPFTADELRAVRDLKARAESTVARRGAADREIKLGPGGIRDIEFAVQVLQLVHGGADGELRRPATLDALAELADGGYVARPDADVLAGAYRFLRTVEHRLQLDDERQVHAVPADPAGRERLARVMGFEPKADASARGLFDDALRVHRREARAIHERLWWRPLLDDLARTGARRSAEGAANGDGQLLAEDVIAARLEASGFTNLERTRQAVNELTRGLTRASRLMQQLLPVLLDWLSATPDPDLGLLGLRQLASGPQRSMVLATAFRDKPHVAERLCTLLGTSRMLAELLRRNPDLISALGDPAELAPRSRAELVTGTRAAAAWRGDPVEQRQALKRFTDREGLRIAAHDVLDHVGVGAVGRALSDVAEAALEAAVTALVPELPFCVVAMGRLGGGELSYASDLDLLVVYEGTTSAAFEAAERAAGRLLRFLGGDIPHIYDVDTDLRPEGRDGPLARSLEGFEAYLERWAEPWERLAMVRARPVAGDADVGRRFMELLAPHLWEGGLSDSERTEIRRIKARVETERIQGDDPEFHLKLGKGGLADVEFCVQLLQLEHSLPATGTADALARLHDAGVLDHDELTALAEAHQWCEQTRNRLFLVRAAPGDSLPVRAEELARLARALGTSAADLREDYRRVTRRARRVVERRFYGVADRTA